MYSRVLGGESAVVIELQQDLAYSMMLPYLGHAAAAREAAKPPSVQVTAAEPA